MKNNASRKSIGNFALLSTCFLLIAGIAYLNVPYEQKLILFSETYFYSFLNNPYPYYIFWSGMILHAIFMIGLISCFKNISDKLNGDIFNFLSILAIIGYAIMTLTYVSRLYYMPHITSAFVHGNSGIKNVIVALGTMEFDKFILAFGFSAIWFFTISVFSYHYKILNKMLILMQSLIGVGYMCGLIGYVFQIRYLISALIIIFLLFPIWAICLFAKTRKTMI